MPVRNTPISLLPNPAAVPAQRHEVAAEQLHQSRPRRAERAADLSALAGDYRSADRHQQAAEIEAAPRPTAEQRGTLRRGCRTRLVKLEQVSPSVPRLTRAGWRTVSVRGAGAFVLDCVLSCITRMKSNWRVVLAACAPFCSFPLHAQRGAPVQI